MALFGLEAWAALAWLGISGVALVLFWRVVTSERVQPAWLAVWHNRGWPIRAVVASTGLVGLVILGSALAFVSLVVALDLRLLEPSADRLQEVTGVAIPEDREDYEAWHDEFWLDGDYWVTFSVARSNLSRLLKRSKLPELRPRPASVLVRRLAAMYEGWDDVEIQAGLVSSSPAPPYYREAVVDLSDPDRATLYLRAGTT